MSKEYWEGPYYDYLIARMDEANSKNLKKSILIKLLDLFGIYV